MSVKYEDGFRYSGSSFGNFTCTWTLKNFGQRCRARDPLDKIFYNYEGARMRIYADGLAESERGFLSFCLDSPISNATHVDLNLAVTLENTEEYRICMNQMKVNKYLSEFKILKMIERKSLLPLLHDDILVCFVEVTHSSTIYVVNHCTERCQPDFRTHVALADDMRQLLETGKGSDGTISVSSTSIPVHIAILSARSKVFAAMFDHDTTEKTTRCVSITDFEVDSVRALLQFIYSGIVDELNVELAGDLVRAADKYDMDDLKLYCEIFLFAHFKIGNIGQILFVADMYNAPRLRKYAIEYFLEHKDLLDFDKHQFLRDRKELLWDLLIYKR